MNAKKKIKSILASLMSYKLLRVSPYLTDLTTSTNWFMLYLKASPLLVCSPNVKKTQQLRNYIHCKDISLLRASYLHEVSPKPRFYAISGPRTFSIRGLI